MHDLHFDLAATTDVDELCRAVVTRAPGIVGLDRIGVWFLDPEDPEWFYGSFGTDETGGVRDERTARVRRDWSIYDDKFFNREIPYRRRKQSPIYDDQHAVVGQGELIVTPIWNGTDSIGALSADNLLNGKTPTDDDCQLLVLLARMVGHLVTIKRSEKQLREYTEKLEQLATVDGLTGLLNRNTGIRFLHHHITRSCRSGTPTTICFLDLDRLKEINDRYGHRQGDLFISTVANLIDRAKRLSDAACRMGGDEFMIILPDSTVADGERLMQRLGLLAGQSPLLHQFGYSSLYSYGIASFQPETARRPEGAAGTGCRDLEEAAEELIHLADLRMYEHKRSQGSRRPE